MSDDSFDEETATNKDTTTRLSREDNTELPGSVNNECDDLSRQGGDVDTVIDNIDTHIHCDNDLWQSKTSVDNSVYSAPTWW